MRDLWPHQARAVDSIMDHIISKGATRLQYVAACGAGKTQVSIAATDRLTSRRTVFLAPSLALLSQAATEWKRELGGKGCFICSDPTVSGETGWPVCRSATEWQAQGEADAVFCTYQSAKILAGSNFDFLIADEAHHIAGEGGKRASIAVSEKINARFRLFMTATPRIFSDDCSISMDDEDLFGPVADRFTFEEAISLDVLSDYQIAIVGIETEGYLSSGGSANQVGVAAAAIEKAVLQGLATSLISFHPGLRSARALAAMPMPTIETQVITGNDPVAERIRALSVCAGSSVPRLFTSCRALSEGVDIPAVDGVVFVHEKTSTVDIIQCVGRSLRKDPFRPRKKALILLPAPIPLASSGDDEEAVFRSWGWRQVRRSLRAMCSMDERLRMQMEQDRRDDATKAADQMRVIMDERYAGKLRLFIIESNSSDRWGTYKVLRRLCDEGLDLSLCSATMVFRGFPVGARMADLRHMRKAGKLDKSLEQALSTLPGWIWEPQNDLWRSRFEEVRAEWGDGSRQAKIEGSQSWLDWQRIRKAKGVLETERVSALESLPNWAWDPRKAYYRARLAALGRYVNAYGHARPHSRYVSTEGFDLGKWVVNMRLSKKRGHLSIRRQQDLESLNGWSWNPRRDGLYSAHRGGPEDPV